MFSDRVIMEDSQGWMRFGMGRGDGEQRIQLASLWPL